MSDFQHFNMESKFHAVIIFSLSSRPLIFEFNILSFFQTVETQKTVKESQGKEEKITTFQKGDQTYSITILKDADGEEKRFENFINIDEGI